MSRKVYCVKKQHDGKPSINGPTLIGLRLQYINYSIITSPRSVVTTTNFRHTIGDPKMFCFPATNPSQRISLFYVVFHHHFTSFNDCVYCQFNDIFINNF